MSLRDEVIKSVRRPLTWLDKIDEKGRQEILELVSDLRAGKLPPGVTLTHICRAVKRQFGLSNQPCHMARVFNEQAQG